MPLNIDHVKKSPDGEQPIIDTVTDELKEVIENKKYFIGIQVSKEVKDLWRSNFIDNQWKKLVMSLILPALAKAISQYGSGKFHTAMYNASKGGSKIKLTISFEKEGKNES